MSLDTLLCSIRNLFSRKAGFSTSRSAGNSNTLKDNTTNGYGTKSTFELKSFTSVGMDLEAGQPPKSSHMIIVRSDIDQVEDRVRAATQNLV